MGKYWTTVRVIRMNPVKTRMYWMAIHSIRYGRQLLAQYTVSDLAPGAGHLYLHKNNDSLNEITLMIYGKDNEIKVKEL